MGKGLFDSAVKTSDAGNKFAAQALSDVAKNWDIEALEKHAAKEFQEQVKEADLKVLLALYKEKLGTYKSAEPFTSSGIQAKTNNGESYVLVTTKSLAQFEKAKGTVTLEVLNRNDQWKVLSIEVESDALKE